jgi:hypothetical protein
MICHKHRAIFIHIPKTGGTSVEAVMTGHDWWRHGEHPKHSGVRALLGKRYAVDLWNSYFKFTIIRNPWDRLWSYWQFAKNTTGVQLPFKQFIQSGNLPRQQCSLLHDHDLRVRFDSILKFEEFPDNFAAMYESQWGKQLNKIPHKNPTASKNYFHHYDEETAGLVADRYMDDIDLGDYTFGSK